MDAFILETLVAHGWRRGGEVFWTLEDATEVGRQLIKRRHARRVRVLKADLALNPVAELPLANTTDAEAAS